MTKQTTANVNGIIDAFQGAQADFVDQYVKNEDVANNLHSFINAQTKFAKQTTRVVAEYADLVSSYATKLFGTK